MARVFVGIGTNVGDRERHMAFARQKLGDLPKTRLVALSPSYETDPVGPTNQDHYLNAVAHLESGLPPFEMLNLLQQIETDSGRQPQSERTPWGPRTLDLDLLLFGSEVICTDHLTVPHPLMHERWFVLKPMVDLDPNAVHPVLQMTVQCLLESIGQPAKAVREG